jgi:hypothetical protein
MRIATHHPSGVACGLNRTTISALTWSNLGKRRNGGAVKKGIEIEVIWEDQNVVESVALRIPIEAATIDSFVSQVRDLKREIGARAYLQMAK